FLDLAAESYLKAIKINPNSALPYNVLGLVYWKKGELEIEDGNDGRDFLEQAISKYQKSIELTPNFAAYNNVGLAALSKANYEIIKGVDAISSYDFSIKNLKLALELNPQNTSIYNSLGTAYMDKWTAIIISIGKDDNENFDLAIEHFNKSLELDPSNADPYYNLGFIYSKKALNNLSRAIDPNSFVIKAKEFLQKATSLNPDIIEGYIEQSYAEIIAARWEIEQNRSPITLLNKAQNILNKIPANQFNASYYIVLAENYRWQAEWQIRNKKLAQNEILHGLDFTQKALADNSKLAEAIVLEGVFYLFKAKEETSKKETLAKQAEKQLKMAIEINSTMKKNYEPLMIEARNLQKK
ncbi:MAG: serine/threonine kinase family protein, partial [bacterium]